MSIYPLLIAYCLLPIHNALTRNTTMKKYIISIITIFFLSPGYAKTRVIDSIPKLPVIVLPAKNDADMPMVLLITGDGGWKDFDPKLANQFVNEKIPVVALNALHYFWNKKSPEQTTGVVQYLLNRYMDQWRKKTFILVGFSFGADVMPFIVNRLPSGLMNSCRGVVLFSPGTSTDFEIHIAQMLSNHRKWKYDVVQEMEAMKPIKLLCFFGDEEHEFPVKILSKPDWEVMYLKGGHHYEENKDDVGKMVLEKLGLK